MPAPTIGDAGVAHVRLTIVKLGADDPLDRIVDALRNHDDIDLVPRDPIGLDQIDLALGRRSDVGLLLILGPEAMTQRASERVRDLQPDLTVVTVAIETGRTSLTLQDPNLEELAKVIVALGHADRASGGFGKILSIRSRVSRRQEPERERRLPTVIESGIVPANIAILAAGRMKHAVRLPAA